MGWGDIGANYNQTRDTPFLDQLASISLRLPDYHSGASICSVSRAALLTGPLSKFCPLISLKYIKKRDF